MLLSSSHQATRLYFIFMSMVYLSYDLRRGGLTQRNWLTGYKIIFLVATVKSIVSYVHLELNTLLERTRQLQSSALSTTTKGEVFALYREERLSDHSAESRYSKQALGHGEQILFNPYDQHQPPPVFWCSLMMLLILYNTAHLALVPLSYISPLLFGTPAYMLYWVAMRTSQMMLQC